MFLNLFRYVTHFRLKQRSVVQFYSIFSNFINIVCLSYNIIYFNSKMETFRIYGRRLHSGQLEIPDRPVRPVEKPIENSLFNFLDRGHIFKNNKRRLQKYIFVDEKDIWHLVCFIKESVICAIQDCCAIKYCVGSMDADCQSFGFVTVEQNRTESTKWLLHAETTD